MYYCDECEGVFIEFYFGDQDGHVFCSEACLISYYEDSHNAEEDYRRD